MKTLIPFLIILRLLIAGAFAASLPVTVPVAINRTTGQLTTTNFFKQNSNALNEVVAPTAASIKDSTSAGRALMTATDHATQRSLMKVSAVFSTLPEALASTELVAGQIVRVYSYNSNVPYASARDFVVTNGIPATGTNWWGNYQASSGLYLSANVNFRGRHHASWWGFNGDGVTDNAMALQQFVNYTTNHTVALELDPGWYVTSYAPRFRGNHPITIISAAGSYETGWNPTNDITAAKLIYNGPATNVFVDFTPAQGIHYGLKLNGITIDANGLAETAVKYFSVTRADMDTVRMRNATEIVCLVDNSQYNTFRRFTISSAELPFMVQPKIGLALTNQANANILENAVINGATEFALDVSDLSKLNRVSESGMEGNIGGGIRNRATANENAYERIWMEQNGDTNHYVQADFGAYHLVFSQIYCEGRLGNAVIDCGHSTFQNSTYAQVTLGTNAGHNTLDNLILGIGERPIGTIRFQTLRNVTDGAALIRTNTMPDPLSVYDGFIDFFANTNAYPKMRLTQTGIFFGNGTNGDPLVGWQRASDLSILSSNTVLLKALASDSGALSVSVTNESYARFGITAAGKISIGSGAATADVNLARIGVSTLSIDSSLISIISGTNSTVLSAWLAGSGATQPNFRLQEDGRIELGPGGSTAADVQYYRESAGVLRVNNALSINGTNILALVNQLLATGTLYPTISSAVDSTVLSNGQQILVLNYATNLPWYAGRVFSVTNSLPAWGTNVGNTFAVSGGSLWLIANDRNNRVQDVSWWGAVGDGSTDCRAAVQAALSWNHYLSHATDVYTWSKGGVVQFSPFSGGRYYHSAPIEIDNGDIVQAVDPYAVKLVRNGDYDGIVCTNAAVRTFNEIRSLGFVNSITNGTNAHIRLRGLPVTSTVANNLMNGGVHGIVSAGVQKAHFVENNIVGNTGIGIDVLDSGFSSTGLEIRGNEVLSGTTASSSIGLRITAANTITISACQFENQAYGAILSGVLQAGITDTSFEHSYQKCLLFTNYSANVSFKQCRFRNSQNSTNGAGGIVESGAFVQNVSFDGSVFENSSTNGLTALNAISLASGSYGGKLSGAFPFTGFTPSRPVVGRFNQDTYIGGFNFLVADQPASAPAYGSLMSVRNGRPGGLSTVGDGSYSILTWERYSMSPLRIWNLNGEHSTNEASNGGNVTLYSEEYGSLVLSTATLASNLTYTLSTAMAATTATNVAPYSRLRLWRSGTNGSYTCTVAGAANRSVQTGEGADFIFDPSVTNWVYVGSVWNTASGTNSSSAVAATNLFTHIERGYQPGTNLYATVNTTNAMPIRVFDPDTEWHYRYIIPVPGTISQLASNIYVKTWWRPIIGNTNSQTIVVSAKYQGLLDTDSLTAANLVTNACNGTTWLAFTNTLSTSNMTVGSPFVLNISAPTTGSATNYYQHLEGVDIYWN